MELKPQDIVVALKLCICNATDSYAVLGKALGISASEVHAAVHRLIEAGLADPENKSIQRTKLRDFIIHGVPYAFPAKLKEMTRGMPTAWSAPVMAGRITQSDQSVPVWPAPDGKVKGASVQPLYASVVKAATNDSALYDLLALVDAICLGRARDRNIAEEELTNRLRKHD
jgi:DNA-binding Lrp family transcriptional regulator